MRYRQTRSWRMNQTIVTLRCAFGRICSGMLRNGMPVTAVKVPGAFAMHVGRYFQLRNKHKRHQMHLPGYGELHLVGWFMSDYLLWRWQFSYCSIVRAHSRWLVDDRLGQTFSSLKKPYFVISDPCANAKFVPGTILGPMSHGFCANSRLLPSVCLLPAQA